VDPDGRRVMRIPNAVTFAGRGDQTGELTSSGYPELCRMLLVRPHQLLVAAAERTPTPSNAASASCTMLSSFHTERRWAKNRE
jgi:hypothetical protein